MDIDVLVIMLDVCLLSSLVPVDWVSGCVFLLYKGKRDKCKCTSFRGIGLLSVTSKVYDKVLLKRIIEGTEGMMYDDQGGI